MTPAAAPARAGFRTRARLRAAAVLLATLAAVALTASLGAWQLRRANQKLDMQAAWVAREALPALPPSALAQTPAEADAQRYRAIRLRGRWVAGRSVFLDQRQMNGRVGFYLVTPLQLDGRPEAVLVQRGWVPRDANDRTALPGVPTPAGVVEVEGHVAPPPARLYELGAGEGGAIRQNLDLDAFAAETGLRLAPLSVQQADPPGRTADDGLLRRWPRPAVEVQKHHGYAFQWFALCALLTGLYVWFQLLRPRFRRRA